MTLARHKSSKIAQSFTCSDIIIWQVHFTNWLHRRQGWQVKFTRLVKFHLFPKHKCATLQNWGFRSTLKRKGGEINHSVEQTCVLDLNIRPRSFLDAVFSTPYTLFCLIFTIDSELIDFPFFTYLSEPGLIPAGFQWTGSTPAEFQEAFQAARPPPHPCPTSEFLPKSALAARFTE